MDFFEGIDEDPDNELQAEVREKLERQRKAEAAATEAKNKKTEPIGAGAYLAKMAAKTATDKKKSAAKDLVKTALKKKNEKISIEPAVGDEIAAMIPQQQGQQSGGGGGGAAMLSLIGKIAGTAIGGPAGGMIGGMAGQALGGAMAKDGGQIAPKIKAKPKAKKRVVRGVGAAKRGYGKATYSKKMY